MRFLWLFVLIALDGVVPLVPGEGALLSQTPAAAASGPTALVALGAIAAVAALVGDLTTYTVGRRIGSTRFAWQRRTRVARTHAGVGAMLERRGATFIVAARFVPGWRVAVSFAAGATHLPRLRFLAASIVGVSVWATYMVGIGSSVAVLTGGSAIVVAVISLSVMTVLTQSLRWWALRRGAGARTGPRSTVPATHSREPTGTA